eukprot:CAMPEP_0175985402 /NCGR_PEP_ID=MMETSP0108-20121206/49540_1 /TAXON_ID=195067 ORGANISM="Goniomonas pacifica, Strain CCMP1869" /NCGR_SAMPLE_ID=MMETSP0108 /ASSEMBLY_ACC=CAM_ASM_000204 /LENGTH=50 /DNA_ID=CAMNT_0017316377 /DNA_START=31 /DNA_END=180 /DNA_ORIENTATION=+
MPAKHPDPCPELFLPTIAVVDLHCNTASPVPLISTLTLQSLANRSIVTLE